MFAYHKCRQHTIDIFPGKTANLRRQLHFAPLIIDDLRFYQSDACTAEVLRVKDFVTKATLTFSKNLPDVPRPTATELMLDCLGKKTTAKQFPEEVRARANSGYRFRHPKYPTLHRAWQLRLISINVSQLRLYFVYTPSVDDDEPLTASLSLANLAGFDELVCHAHASDVSEFYRCSVKNRDQSNSTKCTKITDIKYSYTHFATLPVESPSAKPSPDGARQGSGNQSEAVKPPKTRRVADYQFTKSHRYSYT